jgi:hypothetical protein
MVAGIVKVSLGIEASERAVFATLIFSNESSTETAYIERFNGCLDGSVENDVFRITRNGKEVEYVGPLEKRRAPGAEDFAKLPPGERLTRKARLDEAYAFPPGAFEYKALYSALHPYPDRPGFVELTSDEVVFTLKK